MIIYFMIESLLGGVKEDFQVEISLCNVILDWQQTQQSQCGSENSRSYDWYVNEKVAIDRDLATGWCLSSALADTFLKQVKICCKTLQMRQGKCPRKVICLSKKTLVSQGPLLCKCVIGGNGLTWGICQSGSSPGGLGGESTLCMAAT